MLMQSLLCVSAVPAMSHSDGPTSSSGSDFSSPESPSGRGGGLPYRMATDRDLVPESRFRIQVLNELFKYHRTEKKWRRAYYAEKWSQVPKSVMEVIDREVAIWKGKQAREKAEQEKEAEYWAKREERRHRRYEQAEGTRRFLKQNQLTELHEAATPKTPDPLAAANPLSLEYAGRRRRTPSPPKERPSPKLEQIKKAEARGFEVTVGPPGKREKARVSDADAMKAADDALSMLTPEQKQQLLAKHSSKAAPTGIRAPSAAASQEQKTGLGRRRDYDPVAHLHYFNAKVEQINAKRGPGNELSAKSRTRLYDLCEFHYTDTGREEQGFAGSLVERWDAQFYNLSRHPPEKKAPAAAEQKGAPVEEEEAAEAEQVEEETDEE